MTQQERLERIKQLRKEYLDPNRTRSIKAITLEGRALKFAYDMVEKKYNKLI